MASDLIEWRDDPNGITRSPVPRRRSACTNYFDQIPCSLTREHTAGECEYIGPISERARGVWGRELTATEAEALYRDGVSYPWRGYNTRRPE